MGLSKYAVRGFSVFLQRSPRQVKIVMFYSEFLLNQYENISIFDMIVEARIPSNL